MIKMRSDGFYGVVNLAYSEFIKIPERLLISGCTEDVKFLCANEEEGEFLESVGVELYPCCDFYKCVLDSN